MATNENNNSSTDNLVMNGGGGGGGYQTKMIVDYSNGDSNGVEGGIVNGAFHHHDFLGAKEKGIMSVSKTIDEDYLKKEPGACEEEDDDDPLKEEVPENARTNYVQTLMNLMNGIIGSGVLSMPLAFMNGGWLVSLILTPIIGMISAYCIHLLLAVNVYLTNLTNKSSPFDYHDMAEYAFVNGPKRLQRYAKTARMVVITTIVGTQVGACCVYYVFIATNVQKFLDDRMGKDHSPSRSICLLIILPVVVGINWIRNIKYLSYMSALSNVLQVAGISVVLYNLFSKPIQDIHRLPMMGDKIPQYFVTTLFIFEGSSVSMSLYKAIRKPRQFRMPLGVLNVGAIIIMFFYSGVGFLGYLQYGDKTEGTITGSLPSTPLYDAVQLSYAIVVLGTYPVLLYVPIQVLWGIIKKKIGPRLSGTHDRKLQGGFKLLVAELAFRAGLVLITYILAEVIPKLDLIIALVGAVTSSSIAVMIPSILHTVTFWETRKDKWAKARLLGVNLVLFTIGLASFILGVIFSMKDIIDSYRFPDGSMPPVIPPGRNETHFPMPHHMMGSPWNGASRLF